jgi:gas vesicle protein
MNKSIGVQAAETLNWTGLLTGIFIGGLAGFVTMMLFAPRSGKNTREQIWQRSAQLQGRAAETFDELVILSQFDHRKILAGTRA